MLKCDLVVACSRNMVGIIADATSWLESQGYSPCLPRIVAREHDVIPEGVVFREQDVCRVDGRGKFVVGDLFYHEGDLPTVIVMNGGTTPQTWALAEFWKLGTQQRSEYDDKYGDQLIPVLALDVQRDGVAVLGEFFWNSQDKKGGYHPNQF